MNATIMTYLKQQDLQIDRNETRWIKTNKELFMLYNFFQEGNASYMYFFGWLLWYCGRLLLALSCDSLKFFLFWMFLFIASDLVSQIYKFLLFFKSLVNIFLTAILGWCVSWKLSGCDRKITDSHELINLIGKKLFFITWC